MSIAAVHPRAFVPLARDDRLLSPPRPRRIRTRVSHRRLFSRSHTRVQSDPLNHLSRIGRLDEEGRGGGLGRMRGVGESDRIAKLLDEWRAKRSALVCVGCARAGHGLSAFSSYFLVAGSSIARARITIQLYRRTMRLKACHAIFGCLYPGAQSKRPPFRSRNEPTGPRLFLFFFSSFHFVLSLFSANSIFRYRIIDSNL